jgi:sulfur-oxidizing protein SoxA
MRRRKNVERTSVSKKADRASTAVRRGAGVAAVLAISVAGIGLADEIPLDQRRSGYDLMAPETQAMQKDDGANPGMLWVRDGEARWNDNANVARACVHCHGAAQQSMRGVAVRYPAFDAESQRVVDLEGRVNLCRARHQKAEPLAYESQELLALTAYVAHQSRGLPIAPSDSPQAATSVARGRALFDERQGQLDFACRQCHDDNWGKRLAGSVIPQGHPTGYPLYRLEWQALGSLQRRLRGCMVGVRAEPYPYGSQQFVDLTSFLMWRARGMPMDAPAVRP